MDIPFKGWPQNNWGGVQGGVPTQKEAHYNPPQHAKPPTTQMHRRVGGIWGDVYTPGVYNIQGMYKHMGHTNVGHAGTPKYKNMPSTKK